MNKKKQIAVVALCNPNNCQCEEETLKAERVVSKQEKKLIKEFNKTEEKLETLHNTINSEEFKELHPNKQYLLRRQSVELSQYLKTLDLMIKTEKGEVTNLFDTIGDQVIGGFETFKYDERKDVFEIKETAKKLINAIESFGGDRQRRASAYFHIETGAMYGVKSLFVKNQE